MLAKAYGIAQLRSRRLGQSSVGFCACRSKKCLATRSSQVAFFALLSSSIATVWVRYVSDFVSLLC